MIGGAQHGRLAGRSDRHFVPRPPDRPEPIAGAPFVHNGGRGDALPWSSTQIGSPHPTEPLSGTTLRHGLKSRSRP